MGKRRIVVKIGSSSLTDKNGSLSKSKLQEHVEAIALLKGLGHEVILISSGAVAAGFNVLGYPVRPTTMAGKQAAAAVGQGLLMQHYTEALKAHSIVTAQLLLTRQDFQNRTQYSNAYASLSELLKRGALPIINENDSTSIEELTFGDNDMLSALVSGLVHADLLCILTDVNGLYDSNPMKNPDAKKYHYLPHLSNELIEQAGATGSSVGTGGMKSKVLAAKTALSLGVQVFIGKGKGPSKLIDILEGKGDGTYIGDASELPVGNKKQWISLHSQVSGTIQIDSGAEKALILKGKSLLPAGVIHVEGHFEPGDVVTVVNRDNRILGKGQISVSAEQLRKIQGRSSEEAKQVTSLRRSEVIHRDNWVSYSKETMKQ
ncbi:glutamate 5-kinase [Halalkalibacterium ligniniphilum]|uniref:glutamate 5-kinase n=1 Tax=Halalkalibacterium ligniniphilum TaxID=1134413 RepID=UPI000348BBCD|nr:glutamate 5-kinase [Halalkalibacterium ligniniphilum]